MSAKKPSSAPAGSTIVFLHGLFMNPKSWGNWVQFFSQKGYRCYAPAYPFHDGEPEILRKNIDPGLGTVTFGQVITSLTAFIKKLPEAPILIAHSMGGLCAQRLLQDKQGSCAVLISTAPPRGISSLKFSFLRANLPTVNPLKGDSVDLPSISWFHYAFCNTMTMAQTEEAYRQYVVPEGRNIPRSTRKQDGTIDVAAPHPPMLFIGGEQDHIIPWSLVRKNFEAYSHSSSLKALKTFAGRTHFICNQQGWEEVAGYVLGWIQEVM